MFYSPGDVASPGLPSCGWFFARWALGVSVCEPCVGFVPLGGFAMENSAPMVLEKYGHVDGFCDDAAFVVDHGTEGFRCSWGFESGEFVVALVVFPMRSSVSACFSRCSSMVVSSVRLFVRSASLRASCW